MFTGEYEHSVDAKNRIFVPARFREELGETFMVVRSIRGQVLKVYSLDVWREYINPIKAQERRLSEKALRYLHRNAAQVTPDSQGRIVLPPALVQYAGIVKGAVIVGCGSYSEIWAEEAYETMVEEENLESMRAVLESYGL